MAEASTQDRIAQLQSQALLGRLKAGAQYLGHVYRQGDRCTTGGWSGLCSCVEPTRFCRGKRKWIQLMLESNAGAWRYEVDPKGSIALIEAMLLVEFDALGITIAVPHPKARKPILVGPNGTCWQTIQELKMIEELVPEELPDAIEAVLKIQEAGRRR